MRKLIGLLALLGGFAIAQVNDVDRASLPPSNFVKNPGFENGTQGWSASGGSFSTTTTSPAFGKRMATFDASSTGQTLRSAQVAIPVGLRGKSIAISCAVKSASASTYTIGTYDGTTSVSLGSITSDTNYYARTIYNTVAPTSGNLAIEIKSVASNEPQISIDNCYIADAFEVNVGTVAQAQLMGTLKVTGCSGHWDTTSASYASGTTRTGCTYTATGQASSPSTMIAAFKFASLPAGEYMLQYEGVVGLSTGSAHHAYFKFTDGTNDAREESAIENSTSLRVTGINQSISYSTAQSNVQFEIKMKVSGGSTAFVTGTSTYPGVFKLWRFPSSSEIAVRVDNANTDWSNGLSSSFTPGGFGTTTLQSIWTRREGDSLHVRGYWKNGTVAASTAKISLPSGYTINSSKFASTTSAQQVGYLNQIRTGASGSNQIWQLFYDGSDTSAVYIAYQSASDVFTKVNGSSLASTGDGMTFDMLIPITGWTNNQSAPLLVGSVTSNSTGIERVERARVYWSSGTPTIRDQSGSWLGTATDTGTGQTNIAMTSGLWSSVPACWCKYQITLTSGSTVYRDCQATATTTTNLRVTAFALDSTAHVGFEDATDNLDIGCMGPR